MVKGMLIFCAFLVLCIVLVFLPPKPALALNINPDSVYDVGFPTRLVSDQTLVNVTGPAKSIISGPALSKLKRELAKDGWKVAGKPFFSNGKWLLKFSRTLVYYDQMFMGVLLPNMYYDKATKCVRYSSNNRPVAGMPCNELG